MLLFGRRFESFQDCQIETVVRHAMPGDYDSNPEDEDDYRWWRSLAAPSFSLLETTPSSSDQIKKCNGNELQSTPTHPYHVANVENLPNN